MESNKRKKLIDRSVKIALMLGILYFGFIYPDSFSDHEKMVHFAAHVGMSFLIASCLCVLCTIQFRISMKFSIIILVSATLVIGLIYKYFEIASEGMLRGYGLRAALELSGFYTSMSQNTAGILAAILLIRYIVTYRRALLHF